MAHKLTHEDSEIFRDFMSRYQHLAYARADYRDFRAMMFYEKHVSLEKCTAAQK